jgi:hypothetical protein
VLVVVVAVGGVPVPVVRVVDVPGVGNGLVAAAWSVLVLVVARVGQVRQRVLVVVILMPGMGVALVHVVHVTLALHTGMPASGPVLMIVMSVAGVIGVLAWRHGSSLLHVAHPVAGSTLTRSEPLSTMQCNLCA